MKIDLVDLIRAAIQREDFERTCQLLKQFIRIQKEVKNNRGSDVELFNDSLRILNRERNREF